MGCVTLNLPNFIIGINHLPFMALSIIFFRDIKMKLKANSIEPGQTARMALYWWQRLITFGVSRVKVPLHVYPVNCLVIF